MSNILQLEGQLLTPCTPTSGRLEAVFDLQPGLQLHIFSEFPTGTLEEQASIFTAVFITNNSAIMTPLSTYDVELHVVTREQVKLLIEIGKRMSLNGDVAPNDVDQWNKIRHR